MSQPSAQVQRERVYSFTALASIKHRLSANEKTARKYLVRHEWSVSNAVEALKSDIDSRVTS